MINIKIFGIFLIASFLGGSIYSLVWSIFLMFKNLKKFKKEFLGQLKKSKKIFYISLFFAFIWLILAFFIGEKLLFLIVVILLLFPILFVFAKTIEESCMIILLPASKVTEGDWLYKDIFVGGKKIKANWNGVSKDELILIRKSKKNVWIKQGIPFTPSFLIGFLVLIWLSLRGLV